MKISTFFFATILFAVAFADEDVTTAKPDSEDSTNIVTELTDGLLGNLKNIGGTITNTLGNTKEKIDKLLDQSTFIPSFLKNTIVEAIDKVIDTLTKALTEAQAHINSSVEKLTETITGTVTKAMTTMKRIENCAKALTKTMHVLPPRPVSGIKQCIKDELVKLQTILVQWQEAVQETLGIVTGIPSQVGHCLSKFGSLVTVIEAPTCILSMSGKIVTQALIDAKHITTAAINTAIAITGSGGNVAKCVDTKVNNWIAQLAEIGVDVGKCVHNSN